MKERMMPTKIKEVQPPQVTISVGRRHFRALARLEIVVAFEPIPVIHSEQE
jgi:hypothetical protein